MLHVQPTFFKYARISLTSCGIWPLETNNTYLKGLYEMYRLFIRVEVIGSLLLCGPFLLPYAFMTDKTLFSETLSYEIQYTTLLLKVWMFESKDARDLLKQSLAIERRMIELKDPIQLRILKKNQNINKKLSLIYSVMICSAFVMFCQALLYQTEINWIEYKSKLNGTLQPEHVSRQPIVFTLPYLSGNLFYVGMCAQTLGVIFVIMYSIATQSMFFAFVTFTVVQIQALKNSFKHFENYVAENTGNYNNKQVVLDMVKHNTLTHQKLVRYVATLNNFLKYPILFDFFFYSLQIGATVSKIISELKVGEYYAVIFHINYLCFNYLGLHFNYRSAHEIIFESSNFSTSIYESQWYEQSVEIRKNYVMMMMKMKHPLCLKIGPLYAMSNELLIMIIKAAYSYVALLSKSS